MKRCFVFGLLLTLLAACGKPGGSGGPPKMDKAPAAVHVAAVEQRAIPDQITTFGAVEALSTISVRAQIGGELIEVCFKEGDTVEAGQVLFRIDPRPYEVALQQAEANLAKSKALVEQAKAASAKDRTQADNAQQELKRNEKLLPQKMISQEEFDRSRTTALALQEAVSADEATVRSAIESIRSAEAAIEDAKLRLEYCTIHSPIRGRTGSLQINQGNLVKANDTLPMLTITQVQPIYVSFILPEKKLAEVRRRMAEGTLEVTAKIPNDEQAAARGTLSFIDNAVNNTGTIRLKATFENTDGQLWPGQYVDVVLQLAVQANAIVAPTRAIQSGQSGDYVYVAKQDNTVEVRNVTTSSLSADGMTVIKDGLKVDEKVVIDGQVRLAPGAAISILSEKEKDGGSPSEPKKAEEKPADSAKAEGAK
jgi:membrane fusion protein, multidrug efflux system